MGAHLLALLALSGTVAHAEPITVRAAVELALSQHPILERSAADRDTLATRIDREQLAFQPRVSASASVRDELSDPLNFASSTPVKWGNTLGYDVRLNVEKLLHDSGATSIRVEGARARERQARTQIGVDRLDVELGVVQAYLDILRGQDLLAVSTGAIKLVEEQLSRASALFRATLRPEIDVLSAETQLSQARLARLRDENSIATSQVRLENAIGARKPRVLDVLPVEVRPLEDEAKAISELTSASLGKRAELAGIREGIASIEIAARLARTRTSPVVGVQSGVFATGRDSTGSDASWVPGLGVFASISVSMDLYVGDSIRYEVLDVQAQVRSSRAELERVEQAISLEISRAALAVQISREALTAATAWRAQAERQLQLAQSRYASGVGNFVELNDARSGLVNAQRQEVGARYDLAQSRVSLARGLGRPPAGIVAQP